MDSRYHPNHDSTDPYKKLAIGIVHRAVPDYRYHNAMCYLKPTFERQQELRKLERFFKGNWIQMLTDIDGKKILKVLENEKITSSYIRKYTRGSKECS